MREYSHIIPDTIWYWEGTVPSNYIVNSGSFGERHQDKVWRFGINGTPEGELSGFNVGVTHDSNQITWAVGAKKLGLESYNPNDTWTGGATAGILIDYDVYDSFVAWLPDGQGNGDLRFDTLIELVNSLEEFLKVEIDNANQIDSTAPLINGVSGESGSISSNKYISENQKDVHTFTANENVTWSINGGADASSFSINETSGKLSFCCTKDYESPVDSNKDNAYIVEITAKDTTGNTSNHTVTVSILDVSEPLINYTINSTYFLPNIKDYDGNLHGYLGSAPDSAKTAYKYQGDLDVNSNGITEAIFTNKVSGRWVTASIDPITGAFDYSKHGEGGTTRIVGVYEDPLVAAGVVEKDSDFDSSRTFINDLRLDNLILKTVCDYDSDGFQEVYWSKVDNTAYLRAVMHADGNIQYANYQNLDQMTDYLTSNGFADTVALIA